MSTFQHVKLQVLAPTAGFILGSSRVGQALSPAGAQLEWVDWRAKTLSAIVVARGKSEGGTLTVTLRGNSTGGTEALSLKPNRVIRLLTDAGAHVFEGRIADIVSTHEDERDGMGAPVLVSRTTITAVDAGNALANTTRYGAVSSSPETWYARMSRLATSSPAAIDVAPNIESTALSMDPARWRTLGRGPTITAGGTELLTGIVVTSPALHEVVAYPYLSFDGLTPGQEYTISMRVQTGHHPRSKRLRVVGDSGSDVYGPAKSVGSVTAEPVTLTITFTANAGGARVFVDDNTGTGVPANGDNRIVIGDATLKGLPAVDYLLQSIALEAPLSEHFDIACDSVGAFWWIDPHNVVRCRRGLPSEPVVTLSDVEAPSYVELDTGYNTAALVNDLRVTNLGRDATTEDGTEETFGYVDNTSAATWGRRAGELRTSLDGASAVGQRASTYLARHASIELRPTSVTVLARDVDPAVLDVHSIVRITRAGTPIDARIERLEHTITNTTWSIDLEVGKP